MQLAFIITSSAKFPEGKLDDNGLRGGDDDAGIPVALEEYVGVNHAGTILSPEPFTFDDYLPIKGKLGLSAGKEDGRIIYH